MMGLGCSGGASKLEEDKKTQVKSSRDQLSVFVMDGCSVTGVSNPRSNLVRRNDQYSSQGMLKLRGELHPFARGTGKQPCDQIHRDSSTK